MAYCAKHLKLKGNKAFYFILKGEERERKKVLQRYKNKEIQNKKKFKKEAHTMSKNFSSATKISSPILESMLAIFSCSATPTSWVAHHTLTPCPIEHGVFGIVRITFFTLSLDGCHREFVHNCQHRWEHSIYATSEGLLAGMLHPSS